MNDLAKDGNIAGQVYYRQDFARIEEVVGMKIKEKINLDKPGLIENGPITIVVFGDSITHGSFSPGERDYESVYWNILRKRIYEKRDYVPINVINAGIGGVTAKRSIGRLQTQVLDHHSDLVIVCFGLNDVNGTLEDYVNSLREIFSKIQESGTELIFMTPNMLNTYVRSDVSEEKVAYAQKTAKFQSDGIMDLYIESAVALAKEMNVVVCDCYAKWKELAKTQDTTMLLANGINHPTKEMHKLFADELYKLIFDEEIEIAKNESSMYSEEQ